MKNLLPLWRCNPNDLTFAEVRTLTRHNEVRSIPIVVQRVVAGCIVVVALREVRMRLLALIPESLLNRCHTSVLRVDLSDAFLADVDNLLVVEPSGVALLGAQDALHDVSVPRVQIVVLPYRPRLDDVALIVAGTSIVRAYRRVENAQPAECVVGVLVEQSAVHSVGGIAGVVF